MPPTTDPARPASEPSPISPASSSAPSSASPPLRHNRDGRRALAVWLAAISVYVLAVFHRSSLGVAGADAAERFGISSTQLSTFSVLQLGVYAAMQIPVGALLDKYGSKRMLTVGLVLMTGAQLVFAQVASLPAVIACRVLLGMGDAMIFISVLRLVALWYTPKRAPLFTQMTGLLGGLGALSAAGPLAWGLKTWGWETSYTAAASVGVLSGGLLFLLVKDSPFSDVGRDDLRLRGIARSLLAAWQSPGTRLGLWTHFTSQFAANVFTLLWGFPFLVQGEGRTPLEASVLLMAMTATAMLSSPLMGLMTMRYPFSRSTLVLILVAGIATMWTVVLLWPGRAPLPVLALMCIVTATGGPGSMIGFDLARSFNPPTRLGSASGIVNSGGFLATILAIGGVGVVLDIVAPQGPSTWDLTAFKWAMAVQYPVWIFGVVQVLRHRRRTRAYALETNPEGVEAARRGEQTTFY